MVNKQFDNIPDELKMLSQWVVYGINKEKPKIPYNSRDMTPAKVDESATWSSYDESVARVRNNEAQGIGFVFNGKGYCGVDLDDVFDNGVLKVEARTIYEQLDSYTELSVSGTGLHIIVKAADIALEHHRRNSIEIYDNLRYFIMTGNVYGEFKPIASRTKQIQEVYNCYLKASNITQQLPVLTVLPVSNNADVDEIIAKATRSTDGSKFDALFKGTWHHLGLYPSQSEAEMAFCNQLAYWTSCNAGLMDAVFRLSGLMRDKWDEVHGADTYGNQTIKKAINDFTNYKSQSVTAISNLTSVKPNDYTDVGNANVFSEVFKSKVIYSRSLGFLVWTGQYWLENDLGAISLAMDLSEKMLTESISALVAARTELTIAESLQDFNRIRQAKNAEKLAKEYHSHALRTREAPRIMRMLELVKPALHVELDRLDADPFALNTPTGIVDLQTGLMYPHAPEQLCTKITTVSPNTVGYRVWDDFLKVITCGDKDMEDFLQIVLGMSAVGKVYTETVIAAFGDGSNGKTTFFGSSNTTLGTYGGEIKPETLTTSRNNKSAEVMTLKGKRLIIAAELAEGEYLSSSMLKQLASVDRIRGERKYKDPESFAPSHSLVLFTNHLPKVSSTDYGTWRRITAIRFNATIQGQSDVKNYSDVLVTKAGGAILDWIIKGAVKFIQNNCKLIVPQSVIDATNQYRYDNDWMQSFIEDCCVCDPNKTCKGGGLYSAYRKWAENNGEFPRCKRDFTSELTKRNFGTHRRSDGVYWSGISIIGQP